MKLSINKKTKNQELLSTKLKYYMYEFYKKDIRC
jgi:hypothetical protein